MSIMEKLRSYFKNCVVRLREQHFITFAPKRYFVVQSLFWSLYAVASFFVGYCAKIQVSPEVMEFIHLIPMIMGGSSAIYLLYAARTHLSKRSTLFSYILSTCTLFGIELLKQETFQYPDIGVVKLVMVISVLINFLLIDRYLSIHNLETFFFFVVTTRFLISTQMGVWSIKFCLLLFFLELFQPIKTIKKERILFFLILPCICVLIFRTYNQNPWGLVGPIPTLLGALAGAGAIQFFWKNKNQNWTFFFYLFPNIFLGLYINNGVLPIHTKLFLSMNFFIFLSIVAVAFIRQDRLGLIMRESKDKIRAFYFLFLFFLIRLLPDNSHWMVWTALLGIQLSFLVILDFIFKNEDSEN